MGYATPNSCPLYSARLIVRQLADFDTESAIRGPHARNVGRKFRGAAPIFTNPHGRVYGTASADCRRTEKRRTTRTGKPANAAPTEEGPSKTSGTTGSKGNGRLERFNGRNFSTRPRFEKGSFRFNGQLQSAKASVYSLDQEYKGK